MVRRLFTVTSAVSLVLCVALVVLWVRSYFVADGFSRNKMTAATSVDHRMLVSSRGTIAYQVWRIDVSTQGSAAVSLSVKGVDNEVTLIRSRDTAVFLTALAVPGAISGKQSRDLHAAGFIVRHLNTSAPLPSSAALAISERYPARADCGNSGSAAPGLPTVGSPSVAYCCACCSREYIDPRAVQRPSPLSSVLAFNDTSD